MARPLGGWRVNREQVVHLYLSGLSYREVAESMGMSAASVQYHIERAGISRSLKEAIPLRRFRLDSTKVSAAFNFSPLTPDGAWLLGLVFGDGHIDKTGWNFNITSGDLDVLDKVNRILGGRLTIKRRNNYGVIRPCSARLVGQLVNLYGLSSNKAYTIKFPKLHDSVLPHFVRGLMDSDGSVFFQKGKRRAYLRMAYYSVCIPFLQDLKCTLESALGVEINTKLHRTTNTVHALILCHGLSIRLGEWMYSVSNASNRCDRRYAVYRRAIELETRPQLAQAHQLVPDQRPFLY